MTTVIEILAAIATVGAFVPQAWKIVKSRNTKDLSAAMWVLQVIGFSLWVTYGAVTENWPIVIPNGIALALAIVILTLKIRGE
ncbi:MAG: SemiSWEET transporter [Kofleriaceae bacterium]